MCYTLLANLIWIIDYIPILPLIPIKLFLGLWIILPSFYGETIVYMCLSDYLENFEKRVAEGYSNIVSLILLKLITWTHKICTQNKSSINDETLPLIKAISLEISTEYKL